MTLKFISAQTTRVTSLKNESASTFYCGKLEKTDFEQNSHIRPLAYIMLLYVVNNSPLYQVH